MDGHRWLAGRTCGRTRAAALSLGLLVGSLVLAGPRVPVRAGTETGTCTLSVATSNGLVTDSAVTVPDENIGTRGSGWLPNSEAVLDTGGWVQKQWEFTVDDDVLPIDASGVPTLDMNSARHYGTFVWRASQAAPACVQEVTVTVLPISDMHGYWIHLASIEWMYLNGLTSGCSPEQFCPGGRVTRGQMASFLSRTLDLPATGIDYFTDDESNKHEDNINRLREAGITFGCDPEHFCPDGLVTRAQMASFLVRAFDLPATGTDYFTDDESSTHQANINVLRAAGITYGCGGFTTTFCPEGLVTRAQMATFLFRAMN